MERRAGLPASSPPAITASLYGAAADAEIIAEESESVFFLLLPTSKRKAACHGHGFTQIRTAHTMRSDDEVREGL